MPEYRCFGACKLGERWHGLEWQRNIEPAINEVAEFEWTQSNRDCGASSMLEVGGERSNAGERK